jgi:D-alanyl-D-alanine carboxypeptidase
MKTVIVLIILLLGFSCAKDEMPDAQFYNCTNDISVNNELNPDNEKYQSLLDDITRSGAPGIMMSVSKEGSNIWSGASGKADLASNINMQACNIIRVGSTVKTFTAVTIMLLIEENKLSLDDPITKYLSSDLIRDIENANRVTVRQLLQHSSGIYNYIVNPKFQTASLNDLVKVWKRDELLYYARGMKANFAPGEDVQYSNTNYILLGEIISNIELKPFYKVFEEKIFAPLQLKFTRFAAEDPIPNGLVRGYADLYSNLNVINVTNYSGWDYYTADGGLISNAHDEAVFMKALFTGKILSSSSLQSMLQWMEPRKQDDENFKIYYGLGIFKIDTSYGPAYMHSGDAIGYYACMVYFPDQQTTITWAVNGNYGSIDAFTQSKEAMEKIFNIVLN